MTANRWTALVVLFLARTCMALQFQSIAPVAALIIGDLDVAYAEIGLLVGLYMLPGIVFSLPGGLLGGRFGDRRVVLWGLGLMVIGGLMVGLGGSFAVAVAGRLIAGAGAVLLNVLLAKMVADWFAGREITLAMAVLIDSWPFGLALALAMLGGLGELYAWQTAVHVTTAACGAALVLLALLYRDPPAGETIQAGAERPHFRMPLRLFALSSMAGLVWMFFNVGGIVFISFAPDLLVAGGIGLGEAGFLTSIVMWVTIPLLPLGGWLADRLGRPGLVIVVATAINAALMGLVPGLGGSPALMLAIGVVFALPAGAIVALPVHFLPEAARNVGFGVFYTWYYLGMTVLPPLAGHLRDVTESSAAPLYVAATLTALAAVALLMLRGIEASATARRA
jgi:MFS family permease